MYVCMYVFPKIMRNNISSQTKEIMAPVATRSIARSDPEYVFERYTPKKRRSNRRVSDKEEALKKQKLNREKVIL